jgi:hypothetical protein
MNEKLVKLRAELSYINKAMSNDRESLDLDVDGGDDGIQKRVESISAGIQKERELYEAWRQSKAAITAGIISDEQAQLIQADIAAQQRINTNFENTKLRLEEEAKLLLENQTLTAEEKAARQAEIDAAALEADKSHQEQMKQQAVAYAQATADERVRVERAAQSAINSLQQAAMSNAIGLLDQFAGESKAAAVASIALSKGLAIAQTIQNTGVAVMKAMSVDPTGALAARAQALGAANVAMIAATGLAQAGAAMSGSASAQTYSNGVPATNTTSSAVSSGGSTSQAINISLAGSANYTSADIYGLIDQLNEAASDGYTLNYSGG